MGLLTLLPLLGFSLVLARRLDTSCSAALLYGVSGAVLMLYVGGLAGLLWWTALAIHLVGVCLLGIEIWRLTRNAALPAWPPVSLAVLLVCTTLFWLVHGDSQYIFFDEYSHWGVYLKEMLALDGFWTADTNSMHPRYPPAAPLWQYLFTAFGEPREGTAYVAQFVLLLTPLLVLWERLDWKQWPWILLLLAFVTLALVNFSRGINSIYVDHVIAAWFIGTLLCFVAESPGPRGALKYAVPLAVLALIKESSSAFALAAAGIMGLLLLVRLLQSSSRFRPAAVRAAGVAITIALPAWFALEAWGWHLDRIDAPADLEAIGGIVSGMAGEEPLVDDAQGAEITRRFLEVFTTQQLANDGISRQFNAFSYSIIDLYEDRYRLSTLWLFILFALWWALMLAFIVRGTQRLVWGSLAAGVALTGAAFLAALYLTYRFAAGEYGLVMSSYMRYVQTIVLPMLLLSFAPLVPAFRPNDSGALIEVGARKLRAGTLAAFGGIAALWLFETPYLTPLREPNPPSPLRQQLEPLTAAIQDFAGSSPVWVYLPNDYPNGFMGQLVQYLVAPTPAVVERDGTFMSKDDEAVFDVWSQFGWVWIAAELDAETSARFRNLTGQSEDSRLFRVREAGSKTTLEPAPKNWFEGAP